MSYGAPCNVYAIAMYYYFYDKPYKDNNTWTGAGVWGGGANGVLDPVNKVEDMNDDGVLDDNEKDGSATAPHDDGDGDFDGDYAVKSGDAWEYDHDLSPHDIDCDGQVELPRYIEVPVSSSDEYTMAEVVRQKVI